jgi:phosphatidylserine synthase
MKEKFFARKGVTWVFAIIAIVSGFLFLDSSPTGNVIVNKQSSVNLISMIGLILIACAAVLIAYSAKKK